MILVEGRILLHVHVKIRSYDNTRTSAVRRIVRGTLRYTDWYLVHHNLYWYLVQPLSQQLNVHCCLTVSRLSTSTRKDKSPSSKRGQIPPVRPPLRPPAEIPPCCFSSTGHPPSLGSRHLLRASPLPSPRSNHGPMSS